MRCKDQTYRRLESLKKFLSPKYLTIKNFKNFQRNQSLYMQRLNVNYGVGFGDEERDIDYSSSNFLT